MPSARRTLLVAAAVAVLAACQTGERPSFDTTPGTTAPAGAGRDATGSDLDLYLQLFTPSDSVAETAVYTVRQQFQGLEATATLTRDGTRVALDVRDTQFRELEGQRQTCNLDDKTCTRGFAEQRLSDLQITTGFWAETVRSVLSSPTMAARIGPISTSEVTVAGERATCLEVPGPSRTDRYCALASGILALMDTAAVQIELTGYSLAFDEAVWNEIPES